MVDGDRHSSTGIISSFAAAYLLPISTGAARDAGARVRGARAYCLYTIRQNVKALSDRVSDQLIRESMQYQMDIRLNLLVAVKPHVACPCCYRCVDDKTNVKSFWETFGDSS